MAGTGRRDRSRQEQWTPRGRLRSDVLLARHTTWRVGGPVDRLFQPADPDDLIAFLMTLPAGDPIHWLGFGSNVLVPDEGLRGTVILLHPGWTGIEVLPGGRVHVQAGAACARVARVAARAGLLGAEFLAGIPGTMGGALAMNAGAYGGESWNLVSEVETVDRQGLLRRRSRSEFQAGYRSVSLEPDQWFLSAVLTLVPGDAEAAMEHMRGLLEQRAASQPIGKPSCGSVFRNPPGDHAAVLIEQAGLKGRRIGGALVSPKHANFIINAGDATALDIAMLIAEVQAGVQLHSGILLQPECRFLGSGVMS